MHAVDSPYLLLKKRLQDYVTEHALRNTAERYAVLEAALQCKALFSADDLWDTCQQMKLFLSLATIYNTIELFETCGILLRVPSFSNKNRYLIATMAERSPLLICTQCGEPSVHYRKGLKSLFDIKTLRPARFKISQALLCLYGCCAECSKKKAARLKDAKQNKAQTVIKNTNTHK